MRGVGLVYLSRVLAVVGVGVLVPVLTIVVLPIVLRIEGAQPAVEALAVGSLAVLLAHGYAQFVGAAIAAVLGLDVHLLADYDAVRVVGFLFVALFEGWYSRASAVGVTFLDQTESRAYTRAAVNLYAPVPVRKLTFDTSDTVSFSRTGVIDVELADDLPDGVRRLAKLLINGVAEGSIEPFRAEMTDHGSIDILQ